MNSNTTPHAAPTTAGVDAAAGEKIICRIDVDGRKSDLAAEFSSGGDAAVDEVRAAEGEIDDVDRSFGDGVADERRRHADAANPHVAHSFDAKSGSRPG